MSLSHGVRTFGCGSRLPLDRYGDEMSDPRVHPSADVDDDVVIGTGSAVWHLAQLRSGVRIGRNCVIGRGAYVGPGITMGDGCKIQNAAQLHDPARLGRGVFIGPAVVLTNDRHPRAVDADFTPKRADHWDAAGVTIGDGASIGAGSIVVAGVSIGEWAMVGAGSTVTSTVPAHALVVGTPARQTGWVGHTGRRLEPDGADHWRCPDSDDRYVMSPDGGLSPAT